MIFYLTEKRPSFKRSWRKYTVCLYKTKMKILKLCLRLVYVNVVKFVNTCRIRDFGAYAFL